MVTQADLETLSAGADKLVGDFNDRLKLQQQQERDAKLRQLLQVQEQQAKEAAIARNRQLAEDEARRMGVKPGKYATSVSESGFSVNPESLSLANLLRPLTPAQETAEKATGKQIADWAAAGGRPAMDKNVQSLVEVERDLTADEKTGKTKRDEYDRIVGGMLSTSPSLMGLLTPTEKERRDKARNTALTIARQTDPNPTEKQIEAIMGQIYDPSSSTEANRARISRFREEQQKKNKQMDQAYQNYMRSGYATIGGVPDPRVGGGQAPLSPEEIAEMEALKRELGQ